jgi:hypothetical protein
MEAKTRKLNARLATVNTSVGSSKARLQSVNTKLEQTAGSMGTLRANVAGSGESTKAIVAEFGFIDTAIGAMDGNLRAAITLMSKSHPLTESFATNRTRVAIAGGNSSKYGVPNLAPNNRVMSVVLPMIKVMQQGGPLPARKDRHVATNFVVDTALKLQVPDGVNVVALVRPFDGTYGLPNEQFFVNNRIHGF